MATQNDMIRRFSGRQRVEHLAALLFVLMLIATGILQKDSGNGWSARLIIELGGLERVQWLHRLSGVLLSFLALLHGVVIAAAAARGAALSMLPDGKDLRDVVLMLKYWLWLSDERARFDRYDYRQKFEYWAMLFNGTVMMLSGLILLFPLRVAAFLPADAIPAAEAAHGGPGFAAFLIVIAWHLVNAHLRPEIFPFDPVIFSGTMSESRMEREHPVELDRIRSGRKGDDER